MVGYAVSAIADCTLPVKGKRIAPALYREMEAVEAPVVVVIEMLGDDDRVGHSCAFGGRMTAICKRLGAVGVVTNGGVREFERIVSGRFCCFLNSPEFNVAELKRRFYDKKWNT